jgi:hypothetical protein
MENDKSMDVHIYFRPPPSMKGIKVAKFSIALIPRKYDGKHTARWEYGR